MMDHPTDQQTNRTYLISLHWVEQFELHTSCILGDTYVIGIFVFLNFSMLLGPSGNVFWDGVVFKTFLRETTLYLMT